MRRFYFIALFVCILSHSPSLHAADATPTAMDIAEDRVNITTGFTGTSIVVFGDKNQPGDLIITLEGPKRNTIIRKKDNVFGAWINSSWMYFDRIPSYYDFATSVPGKSPADLLPEDILKEKRIGLESLKSEPRDDKYEEKQLKVFKNALLETKQGRLLYPIEPQEITFISDRLFRVNFKLPSNVPSGEYTLRAFLIRDGALVYEQSKDFFVGLVGFSSSLYLFAQSHGTLYGFVCVFIALFAGWLSNVIVRRN